MLTTHLSLAEKYDYLAPAFRKAFSWLQATNVAQLVPGDYPIEGENIYANVQSYTTLPPDKAPFESHCNYFDLQYIAQGQEIFGYAPAKECTPIMSYDECRDLVFYADPDHTGFLHLKTGDFAIVPPEDAHAPRRETANGPEPVKKVVIKIRV